MNTRERAVRSIADAGTNVLVGAALGTLFVVARTWGSLAAVADGVDRHFAVVSAARRRFESRQKPRRARRWAS